MKIVGLILLFIFNSSSAFSQKPMENRVEKLKSFGKDSLINLALITLKEKKLPAEVSPEDYEITVWANKTEVLVKFKRLIKFIPLNYDINDFEYNVIVNILSHKVSPFDDWFHMGEFYFPSKEEKEKIKFVKKAYGLPHKGFENVIYEHEDSFKISLDNKVAYGRYSIDKKSGVVTTEIQGSYMPEPPLKAPGIFDNGEAVEQPDYLLKEIVD